MKLFDFISQHYEGSFAAAAYSLGVGREVMRTWCRGKAIPRRDEMKRIYEWSQGHVSPNDFYDLPLPRGQRPQPAVSDVLPVVNGRACAAAVFPSPDDEDGDRAAQADLFPEFRPTAGHHAEASS